jgi:hypothetical protein
MVISGSSSGVVLSGSTIQIDGRVGIGINPEFLFDVVGNSGGTSPIASFTNAGNNAGRSGIMIACGLNAPDATSPTSNMWAALSDGDGDDAAYIAWVNGSSNAAFIGASDRRIKIDVAPTKINAVEVLKNSFVLTFRN